MLSPVLRLKTCLNGLSQETEFCYKTQVPCGPIYYIIPHWTLAYLLLIIADSKGDCKMAKLKKGDKAPNFNLINQHGKKVKLADFKGKHLLIYFYPRANTPGCTKQSCNVSQAQPDLKKLGIQALGVSPDTPDKQLKFDEKYDLGFSLLSDEDNSVAKAYGAFGKKTSFGKTKQGIIRSSFLIDGAQKIVAAWYKVKPDDTVPKALEVLKQ